MIVCEFCDLKRKKENCLKNRAATKKTGLDNVQESKKENRGSLSSSEGSADISMIQNENVNSNFEEGRESRKRRD